MAAGAGQRAALVALGALAGHGGLRAACTAAGGGRLGGAPTWERTNHRGETVTLLEGPVVAIACLASAATPRLTVRQRAAVAVAAGAAGFLGAYDDLAGSGDSRGFRGHLRALAGGRVTTGAIKVLGIGGAGLAAGALLRRSPVDAVLAGGVVAGTANLLNLLDLRPGRALKAALLTGAPALLTDGPTGAVLALPLGAAAGLLPADLGERAMLGDAGANALGAVLGVAFAAPAPRRRLALMLTGLVALTAASERISFTRVIEGTPGLRALDGLGRRPALRSAATDH